MRVITISAPRLGIAYQLRPKPGRETVMRAGAGIFYDRGSGQALQAFSGYPFIQSKSLPNVPFP